jgi:hypothetical protein
MMTFLSGAGCVKAQSLRTWPDPTRIQTYKQHLASSSDPTGANADWRAIPSGATLTLLDTDGPASISHIWIAISSGEQYHLKALVLRMYWDNETTPSVESPIGDFWGLGFGEYHSWESDVLSVGPDKALNCFFPMPFRHHARITVTNEGKLPVAHFYYNIEYRSYENSLPSDTVYFHAQYRQAQPNQGSVKDWSSNLDPIVHDKINDDLKGNYVWLDATGKGNYMGVTLSVLENQEGWWGEGDPMFFIDGEPKPSIRGTGSEDYFGGAFDFGPISYSFPLSGVPLKGEERVGGHWSVYRFHLDSPIPFTKSFLATMEHGNANHRSDSYYSVSYWYQAEPHAPFPQLPVYEERIPKLLYVGGPGIQLGK